MLADLGLGDGSNLGTADGRIALDSSVRKTRQGHYCISTTDFFFPLVDSPYLQGRIGAANVLSDLYSEGGTLRLCPDAACGLPRYAGRSADHLYQGDGPGVPRCLR